MENLIDPEKFVGETVIATPKGNDDFHEFEGTVIGVRKGFLQVKDQDDDVFDVEVSQVTIIK